MGLQTFFCNVSSSAGVRQGLPMPSSSTVRRAIKHLEALLPGTPAEGPDGDLRWQRMLDLQRFISSHPEELWSFIVRWAKVPRTDLRDAVACCLLEHLLEYHFVPFFPRVAEQAKSSRRFTDTLSRCYWMGEAAWPASARKLDRLLGSKRPRFRPRRPSTIARTTT